SFSILLLFLHKGSTQYLEHHLLNHLNRDIPACDNFYRHVCGEHVEENTFAPRKVADFYNRLFEHIGAPSIFNTPIGYDYEMDFQSDDNDKTSHESEVRDRCGDEESCYADDFKYYEELYKVWNELRGVKGVEIQLGSSVESKIESISSFIEEMTMHPLFSWTVEAPFILGARIAMVEFVKKNSSFSDFINVNETFEAAREAVISRIEATSWLHDSEQNTKTADELREQIIEGIVIATIHHDFGLEDMNLTRLRKFNRDLTEFYFRDDKTCGIARMDFIFRMTYAYSNFYKDLSPEEKLIVRRIKMASTKNAFYSIDNEVMGLLAPNILREYSTNHLFDLRMPALFTILHEFYHSVYRDPSNVSWPVTSPMECLEHHYSETCAHFGEGECHSGQRTLSEDGPDVEGLRTAYEIFSNMYDEQEKKVHFDEYGVTRDQAFFYSVGMDWCNGKGFTTHSAGDEHSPALIRINGMVTLMPEFSNAFQCKKGDRMYTDEETTCNVFGDKPEK
ncbi:hypothetical protein PFISCL1PPCAC_4215, partial [Pristionchus fissidentatus]